MASEFISKKRIGEILMSKGLITPQQLQLALDFQKENRSKRVGEIWVEAGIISEEILARALATQFNVPYYDVSSFVPKDDLLSMISEDLVNLNQILPLKLENNILTVVTHDPTNLAGFQIVSRMTGYKVTFVVAQ